MVTQASSGLETSTQDPQSKIVLAHLEVCLSDIELLSDGTENSNRSVCLAQCNVAAPPVRFTSCMYSFALVSQVLNDLHLGIQDAVSSTQAANYFRPANGRS